MAEGEYTFSEFRSSTHSGKWHDCFEDCGLKCAWGLGVTRLGQCHWSCCFSTDPSEVGCKKILKKLKKKKKKSKGRKGENFMVPGGVSLINSQYQPPPQPPISDYYPAIHALMMMGFTYEQSTGAALKFKGDVNAAAGWIISETGVVDAESPEPIRPERAEGQKLLPIYSSGLDSKLAAKLHRKGIESLNIFHTMEDVEEIKDELKISGVDFLKLKKAVREFLQSENEETAASPNVLNEHQQLQNDVEAVVAGLNSTLEGVGITNININFNNQKNMVNMVVDSDSENESIEDHINLKEV